MKNHSMPTMVHAGVYSGLLHYFKALEAMGGNPHDGAKVVAKMKEMPTDDPLFGKGSDRAQRPRDSSGLSVRGEEAVGIEGARGITTSWLRPFPPTRPSRRWTRAPVRC